MTVELTSPCEGKEPGETYSGEREEWLVQNGYAKRVRSKTDKHLATDVKADKDPTLAANREDPADVDDFEATGTTSSSVDRQPYPEEQGPVPPTSRPADLEERQVAAEADVKGIDPEDVKESAGSDKATPAQEESTQDGDNSDGA